MRATRRHFSLLLRAMLLLLLKVGKKNEVRTYSTSNMAIPSVVIPSLKSSFSFLLLLLSLLLNLHLFFNLLLPLFLDALLLHFLHSPLLAFDFLLDFFLPLSLFSLALSLLFEAPLLEH